jgi:hypothetical protein
MKTINIEKFKLVSSNLEKEIILYIQGKHAPNPQLELPLEPVKVLPTPEILDQ